MAALTAKKLKIILILLGLTVLAAAGILIFKPTDQTTPSVSEAGSDEMVRGFTFLDLHADSTFTDSVRNRLKDTLGSEAVERKTVLDLEMHYPGFLEHHFPTLHQLNKRLNYEGPRRVRIEHNSSKLIYRYSTAFHYVELFFSNYTQKPLLFRIRAKRDGRDYLATLEEKYGAARETPWQNQKGKSFSWDIDKDIMILSLFTDQYGQPQFEIMICHVGNIEELLAMEKEETGSSRMKKDREGSRLF